MAATPSLALHVAGLTGEIALALVGALGALASLYLLMLAVAAGRDVSPPSSPPPEMSRRRLAIVIPAHDEAALIARCLHSLAAQTYPKDLTTLVVVADNCTDETAEIATGLGAHVLVRNDPAAHGKGHALRWAMDQILAQVDPPDAIVVVDADSVADPGLLAGLAARFVGGAEVVQAEYLALKEDASARMALRAAAILLFHRVRFSGRAVLGLPCSLVGNGMLFSRKVLTAHPWNAFASAEDLEYSIALRLAGIRPQFAPESVVHAPLAISKGATHSQTLRWEGGRIHVVRTCLPQLVMAVLRRQSGPLWDALVDLAVPPLGVLAAGVSVGAALGVGLWSAGIEPLSLVAPWAVALGALFGYVLIGLRAAGAPRSTYWALLAAPGLVVTQMRARIHLLGGLEATTWVRTARPGDTTTHRGHTPEQPPAGLSPQQNPGRRRVLIGNVPVDSVSVDQTVELAMRAVRDRTFTQICTVNLDFLVSARRDGVVRRVLAESQLNIADGAPVVWLSALLRRPVPERVAGVDLVGKLASAAAAHGASIFLIGGMNGAAQLAAARLVEAHPGLTIAGVYEPPHAPLGEMDTKGILRRIETARPDILLVAFGHPKQDIWINMQRAQLPVALAVGVGCTFDVIAGRHRRAPGWMQRRGLEWLFRLLHEPRRLFRRYATDGWYLATVFVPSILAARLRER